MIAPASESSTPQTSSLKLPVSEHGCVFEPLVQATSRHMKPKWC